MKRLVALALLVGSLLVAPMGTANAVDCEFSIPQMPEECLTQPVYDYVTDLQADFITQRTLVNTLGAEAQNLRAQMAQQSVDLTAARQATSLALGERDAALDQVSRLTVTATALQAKVRVLKKRIKKLEAQVG